MHQWFGRDSLWLLLLLTVPAGIMAITLLRWPNWSWFGDIPSTAINSLGSFAVILLSVFFIARYRKQPGILYFSAGLMVIGVIELLHTVSVPSSTQYLWQKSLSGITGGILFSGYVLVRMERYHLPALPATTQRIAWWLGGAIGWAIVVGSSLNLVAETLSPLLAEATLTPLGWLVYVSPIALFLFPIVIFSFQYYRTKSQELFLVTVVSMLLFQIGEVIHIANMWGSVWWFWQLLRLAIYVTVLSYVLKEYIETSNSLATESEERRKAAEALRRANEDWRNSFDSLEDVMLIVDKDYRIENINRNGLNLLGQSREELLGKPIYQVISDKIRDDYFPLSQVLDTGRVAFVERYDETLDRHFDIRCSPAFDGQGGIIKFVILMHDITKRVKAEKKEKMMQRELQVTSRLASIGEMVAGIGHEINNPLTSVIGLSELLTRNDFPEDIREDVQAIHDSARRAAGVVKKLLTFARHNRLEKECADINAIVMGVLEMRTHVMRTSNIECRTRLHPELPQTMANVGQLEQVFLNIIINAEQAMAKAHGGGKLFIKTGLTDGMIRVQVTDNGPGIAAENMERMFEPFFTTKGNEGGTGLGLSVSYGIINEHGGRLLTRSKPGKGASFIVDLPITMTQAKNPRETGNKEEPSPATASGTGVRIIIVDDELDIREVLKRILSSEGYTVEAVSSARAALEILTRQKFDLILLDIKMSDMDGIELYEQLKEIVPDLQRRVICISGELVSARNKAFLDKNRLPYLTKPFGIRDLLNKVASVLVR